MIRKRAPRAPRRPATMSAVAPGRAELRSSCSTEFLVSRGRSLAVAGRIDEAVQTLEAALDSARGRRDSFFKAEGVSRDADIDSFIAYLSVKADVYAAVGQPAIALNHAKLALDLAEKRSDRYQQWRRLEYFGYIQYTMVVYAIRWARIVMRRRLRETLRLHGKCRSREFARLGLHFCLAR